jgi:hypothetical protein
VLDREIKEVDLRALATVSMIVVLGAVPPPEPARQTMAKIVARIQKADYEDDRKALRSLAADLVPYTEKGPLASRALYWRGFAMWRRAMNGFNDSTDPKELQSDLTEAVRAFADATAKDPELADAKAAASACLYSLAYLNKDDVERRKAYITQGVKLLDEAKKAAPENPRVLWVQGGGEWWVPAELGGGHAKAFETYARGLEFARREKGRVNDPLEPSGGEPELLMSIAWSYLNRSTPDVAAAESNARAALALVPNWHYVRDILLPQIRAKAAQTSGAADPARKEASPTDFDFMEGKWAIVYYDIAKDHFRWKADVSIDGGKTWFADQIRIEATRAATPRSKNRSCQPGGSPGRLGELKCPGHPGRQRTAVVRQPCGSLSTERTLHREVPLAGSSRVSSSGGSWRDRRTVLTTS